MKKVLLLLCAVSLAAFAGGELDCATAWRAQEINQCKNQDYLAASKVMEEYLAKSLERYADDEALLAAIKEAQAAWEQYVDQHCQSVFSIWRDGTARTAITLDCKQALTRQRTLVLWESFLTYMDSTPPILPKPKPYTEKVY
jgi:uncharacterized protein YecT (DUF1311 family)